MQKEEVTQKNQQGQNKKLTKLAQEALDEIIDNIKNDGIIKVGVTKEFENDTK